MAKKTEKNPIKENKDLLFYNTTKLTEEEITAFQTFAMKKDNLWASIFISLLSVGLGVGLIFVNTYVGVAIIIAGLLGGLVLFPYITKEQLKRQNLEMFEDGKYINTFEFYEDYLKVTNIDGNKTEENSISQEFKYDELYKFTLFKQYLFIFENKFQGFILAQTCMTKGTIGDLVDFLKSKNIPFEDRTSLGDVKGVKAKKKK